MAPLYLPIDDFLSGATAADYSRTDGPVEIDKLIRLNEIAMRDLPSASNRIAPDFNPLPHHRLIIFARSASALLRNNESFLTPLM